MKRIWMVLLAVVMAVGVVGCSSSGDGFANWEVAVTWKGDTRPSTVHWHLNDNGTFEVTGTTGQRTTNSGTWSQNGSEFKLTFNNQTIYESTNANEQTMSGTIIACGYCRNAGPDAGVWSASKER